MNRTETGLLDSLVSDTSIELVAMIDSGGRCTTFGGSLDPSTIARCRIASAAFRALADALGQRGPHVASIGGTDGVVVLGLDGRGGLLIAVSRKGSDLGRTMARVRRVIEGDARSPQPPEAKV